MRCVASRSYETTLHTRSRLDPQRNAQATGAVHLENCAETIHEGLAHFGTSYVFRFCPCTDPYSGAHTLVRVCKIQVRRIAFFHLEAIKVLVPHMGFSLQVAEVVLA